jgi:hypothetical protein
MAAQADGMALQIGEWEQAVKLHLQLLVEILTSHLAVAVAVAEVQQQQV